MTTRTILTKFHILLRLGTAAQLIREISQVSIRDPVNICPLAPSRGRAPRRACAPPSSPSPPAHSLPSEPRASWGGAGAEGAKAAVDKRGTWVSNRNPGRHLPPPLWRALERAPQGARALLPAPPRLPHTPFPRRRAPRGAGRAQRAPRRWWTNVAHGFLTETAVDICPRRPGARAPRRACAPPSSPSPPAHPLPSAPRASWGGAGADGAKAAVDKRGAWVSNRNRGRHLPPPPLRARAKACVRSSQLPLASRTLPPLGAARIVGRSGRRGRQGGGGQTWRLGF